MLQNARVTGFTVPELLRENQLGVKLPPPLPPQPPPPRLGLNYVYNALKQKELYIELYLKFILDKICFLQKYMYFIKLTTFDC